MDRLTLIAVIMGGFLLIFTLATLLTIPFRRHTALFQTTDRPAGDTVWWRILLGAVLRPSVIIGITYLMVRIANHTPEWSQKLAAIDPRYLDGWYLFWILVLLFNINESVNRLFYYVRRQQSPVPSLLIFLLRLVLIGAMTIAVLQVALDFDTSKLFTSTAVVAAVVGIAMREVLSNVLAGISMNLVGTVEPAQWIAIGDKEGEIIQRNWRETRLRTTGGHILIVPNGVLANGVINNMTWTSPLRRHQLSIMVAFGELPQRVKDTLVAAALSVPEVDRTAKMPDCYLHEFRDYGALYQLRFWSRTYFDRTRLEGTVRERMWYHLRRAGIAIPFPDGGSVYSVAPTLLPVEKDQLASNEKNLYQSGFFVRLQPGRDLSVGIAPAAIAHLISMLRSRIYGPGETLFHQREAGHHGYIVVRGELTGITVYEGVGTTQEFRIGPGELVGEMALLTDLPRSATVQAGTVEVELLELSREAFDVLRSLSPDIQRAIDEHTASRARELLEHLSPLPGQPDSPAPHDPAHPSAASCPTGSRMVTSSPPSGRFRA